MATDDSDTAHNETRIHSSYIEAGIVRTIQVHLSPVVFCPPLLPIVRNADVTFRTSRGTQTQSIKRLSFEEIFGLGAIMLGLFCFLHLAVAEGVALLTLLMGWTAPYFGLLCVGVGMVALFGHRARYWRMEGMVGAYLLWLALMTSSFVWEHYTVDWRVVIDGHHGGMFGRALGNMLMASLGRPATGTVIHAVAWIGTFLLVRYSPLMLGPLLIARGIWRWRSQWRTDPREVPTPNGTKAAQTAVSAVTPSSQPPNKRHRIRSSATAQAVSTGDPPRSQAVRNQPQKASTRTEADQDATSRRGAQTSTSAARRTVHRKTGSQPRGLPPLALLSQSTIEKHEAKAQAQAQTLERIYAEFNQPVKVVKVEVGPAVTRYGVQPCQKTGHARPRPVRVRDILALRDDVTLGMEVERLRYLAPVPGRPYVGIEVPNSNRHTVELRSVLDSWEFQTHTGALRIGLGRDTSGEAIIADLSRAPHLLVGGATGTGKSTCINVLLASLLMQHGPDTLNLVLVDPKQIELTPFDGLPHLVGRVATDLKAVPTLLLWLLLEMDARFARFRELGVRHIQGYNKHSAIHAKEPPLPYIVLVIDELADLMMVGDSQIETRICRLAQKCRATGIHIVLATQRPSVDVLTGVIKANFPTRIAFAVSSNTDSRVVLDTPGAESLLGKGDMLFRDPERGKNVRVQGSWVSDSDIQNVVAYWKQQQRSTPASERIEPWRGLLDRKATGLAA